MTTQQIPSSVRQFFEAHYFEATFNMFGLQFEVEVQTPDLTTTPARTWADWGPMYACALEVDQMVRVTYRCPHSGRNATYHFSPPKIAVNSPSRASERAKTPFTIEILDPARCLKLVGYMNADGQVVRSEVRPLNRGVNVPALLFREAEVRARHRATNWATTTSPNRVSDGAIRPLAGT
jgi:hypothetical protein